MKVTQVVFDHERKFLQYPYHYRIDLPHDMGATKHDAIMDWIHTTGFTCSLVGWGIYVPTEEAATHFVLRWS